MTRPSIVILICSCLYGPVAAAPTSTAGDRDCGEMRRLTKLYLACERGTLGGRLDAGGIAGCSVVYEALKERRFGGDAAALREWYASVKALPPDDTFGIVSADSPACGWARPPRKSALQRQRLPATGAARVPPRRPRRPQAPAVPCGG